MNIPLRALCTGYCENQEANRNDGPTAAEPSRNAIMKYLQSGTINLWLNVPERPTKAVRS